MEFQQFASYGFFILLFIILILVLIYWYQKRKGTLVDDKPIVYPPVEYMKLVGSKCPDYWQEIGQDSNGNDLCKNIANIYVPPECAGTLSENGYVYDTGNKQVTFTSFSEWPPKKTDINRKALDARLLFGTTCNNPTVSMENISLN
jgi:hypothetical protein